MKLFFFLTVTVIWFSCCVCVTSPPPPSLSSLSSLSSFHSIPCLWCHRKPNNSLVFSLGVLLFLHFLLKVCSFSFDLLAFAYTDHKPLGEKVLVMRKRHAHDHISSRSLMLSSTFLFIMLHKVVLTFVSVDEILKCGYSSDSYWAVLSCGAVYYAVQGGSNFWVCGWNPKVWLFTWKLLSSTFLWYCSLCSTRWF